ncbi:MAG: hypothetical protein ACI81L_001018 [Verrucomicrobiales bacterium]|jgi:hypothetical protein
MSDSAAPGWYHAEGDPPNTERYWDGTAWTDGPRPVGGLGTDSPSPPQAPIDSVPGGFGTVTPTPGALPSFGSTPPAAGGFPTGPAPGGFPGAPPAGVYAGAFPETSRAVLALVLSILGIFCCITAPVGAVLGYTEKKGIDAGRRDPGNRGQAIAALVIGGVITGVILAAILVFVIASVATA